MPHGWTTGPKQDILALKKKPPKLENAIQNVGKRNNELTEAGKSARKAYHQRKDALVQQWRQQQVIKQQQWQQQQVIKQQIRLPRLKPIQKEKEARRSKKETDQRRGNEETDQREIDGPGQGDNEKKERTD